MRGSDTKSRRNLTRGDFGFIGYGSAARYFGSGSRGLAILDGQPPLRLVPNATCTPSGGPGRALTGAVYDEHGRLVEESVLLRGLKDKPANLDPESIAIPAGIPRARGLYVYIGRLMPHYGHFITETLARWWATRMDDLRPKGFVAHIHDEAMLEWPYVKQLLDAAGIDRSRLILCHRTPVRVDELAVPGASLQLESHAYQAYRETCLHLSMRLGAAESHPSAQPLYVSRSRLRKGVYLYAGEEVLEEFMRARGARIIHPETMSLRDQYSAFGEHQRIFGVIGSAMHNIVFSRNSGSITYFAPNWLNPTCLVLDRVSGFKSTYFRSTTWLDQISAIPERLGKVLPFMGPARKGRFHRHRRLDHTRIIEWLAASNELD